MTPSPEPNPVRGIVLIMYHLAEISSQGGAFEFFMDHGTASWGEVDELIGEMQKFCGKIGAPTVKFEVARRARNGVIVRAFRDDSSAEGELQ